MMNYLKAENLKIKRTFTKKLSFIAPITTLLLTAMSPLWFQLNGFNWWYVLMLPGYISLFCALLDQKEKKKLNYRAVFSLHVNLKKVWISKVAIIGINVLLSCLILLIGILLGRFLIPGSISIPTSNAIVAIILIVVLSLWQIPLCLFLAKKLGLLGVILIHNAASFLSIAFTTKSLWWLCPYSWISRLMTPVLKILPNGMLPKSNDPLLNSNVIYTGIALSVLLFIVLLYVTSIWFEKQEVM